MAECLASVLLLLLFFCMSRTSSSAFSRCRLASGLSARAAADGPAAYGASAGSGSLASASARRRSSARARKCSASSSRSASVFRLKAFARRAARPALPVERRLAFDTRLSASDASDARSLPDAEADAEPCRDILDELATDAELLLRMLREGEGGTESPPRRKPESMFARLGESVRGEAAVWLLLRIPLSSLSFPLPDLRLVKDEMLRLFRRPPPAPVPLLRLLVLLVSSSSLWAVPLPKTSSEEIPPPP